MTWCEQHKAAAGWRCIACGAYLCPDCTALREQYPVQIPTCTRCRGLAEPLRRHRRELASLASRLPRAFLFPLKGDGLITVLASTLLVTVISYLPGPAATLAIAGVISSLFAVVRAAGRGSEHVDLDEFSDILTGIMLPIVRFSLVMLPLWLPTLVYAFVVGPANMSRGVLVLLALAGVVWTPMAFIGAATNSNLLSLLNPLTIYGCAVKVGRDYALYLATWFALAVLFVPLTLLAGAINSLPIPLSTRFLGFFLMLYAPFVGARVAGLVLHLHGDALGWGSPEEFSEPVLGATAPRGVLPELHVAIAEADGGRRFAPIELAPEPQVPHVLVMASPARAVTELDASRLPGLDPHHEEAPPAPPANALDAAALPSMDSQLVTRIRDAVHDGDTDVAVDAWKAATQRPAGALSCVELTWVGRAAAARGDDATALELLEAAAQKTAAPADLAKARVLLARILDERFHRIADARAWMERVVGEQGGTDGAGFARHWLAKHS